MLYGDLRYQGEPLPALKQLDEGGGTVLLRSFSKISFPGLRVGWAVGPKPLIDRLRQAKESCGSAYRPALAGGAAGIRRIGTPGGAPRAHAGSRRGTAARRPWRPAAIPAARVRAGRGRKAG